MKVLLAVDGSSCSDVAVDRLATHPWPTGTEVCVAIVDAPLGASLLGAGDAPGIDASAYDALVAEQRREATAAVERCADRLGRLAQNLSISTVLLVGSPKEELIRHAERWQADLIVVGSHGRGAVSRLLLGSVSMALAMQAPCSVLIVR